MNLEQANELEPDDFVHRINDDGVPENFRVKSIIRCAGLRGVWIKAVRCGRVVMIDSYFLYRWGAGAMYLSSKLK